jgi:hypothetical protein
MALVECGARVRWVVEGAIAVSAMPCPSELEKLASTFTTVISTSTWAEHSSYGYDPRIAMRMFKRFLWLPVGEYNAPTLYELVKAVKASEPPVLVHCLRGMGRAAVVAAAWLILFRGYRLPEALVEVSRTGSRVETLPQLSVLKALDYLARSSIESSTESSGAQLEYAALLARELGAKLAPGEPRAIWDAAKTLEDEADYTIADLSINPADTLKVTCWVERGAHPRSARRVGCPQSLVKPLENILGAYGVRRVEILNVDRFTVPPASL